MYCCNELNSLCVLSLYEGELIGNVNKLYFDKKLRKLISLELIGENDAKFLLPTKNIYHIGKNAITIKNNLAINLKVEESNLCVCPIGAKAYTIRGEYLGVIKEVSLNEKF
ncbi:MAG: PRC-barrel domain-containing protein, partial [Clostridia bacterium]|nr:PRC-barrel domain-containing protein [Clostridia bacterium]